MKCGVKRVSEAAKGSRALSACRACVGILGA